MTDLIPAPGGHTNVLPGRSVERLLTAAEFQTLGEVPPEVEWFANIENANTRLAYRNDVRQFMRFTGIVAPEEFRLVKRAHLIAWRKELEGRALEASTLRRKLSAVASLFDHLCEANAVAFNPVDGVKRPAAGANEGTSPALGDDQARAILEAPSSTTRKGIRDRAILSVCGALSCARCEWATSNRGEACLTSGCWEKEERSASCPFTRRRSGA